MSIDLNIAIYGTGRFGSALAGALPDGVLVRTGSRVPKGEGVAAFLKGLQPSLVVLAVPDDALASVAAEFAALPDAGVHAYVHPSGARGAEAISALAPAQTGIFHILQSFPPSGGEALIPGSYALLRGSDELLEKLKRLAKALELEVIEAGENFDPIAYHAGAVLASNALIALLDSGRRLLEQAGIQPEQATKMLIPLAGGTLANAHSQGLKAALTGPVARGDAGTIKKHLAVLKGELRRTYVANMQAVCDVAAQTGKVAPDKLGEIRKLLESV